MLSTTLIQDLLVSKELKQAADMCQDLLVAPMKQLDPSDDSVKWLTKVLWQLRAYLFGIILFFLFFLL